MAPESVVQTGLVGWFARDIEELGIKYRCSGPKMNKNKAGDHLVVNAGKGIQQEVVNSRETVVNTR